MGYIHPVGSFETNSMADVKQGSDSVFDTMIAISKFRLVGAVALVLVSACLTQTGSATDGIASNAVIHKAGLTVDWFTNVGDGVDGSIVDWVLNVNEDKATTYFVIEAGNYREVISQHDLGPDGEPYGLDRAVERIEVRKEVLMAEFKNEGIIDVEIKIDQFSLPESTIYSLTREGQVSAIDADSGKLKWKSQIGTLGIPAIGIGVSNNHVAAVSGSRIYLLESATGRVLWSQMCKFAVSAAPAVSSDSIYVPLSSDRMQTFPFEDQGLGSFTFVSKGIGSGRPIITSKTVSWPTSHGDLNVAARFGKNRKSVSYRLSSDNAIVSHPTYKSGILFATSLDGFVYAINEEEGSIRWEISTGAGITQSAIPIGDSVYVASSNGKLFRMDAKTGDPIWPEPLENVAKYLGSGKANLYFTDGYGQLIVVNADSGAITSRVDAGEIAYTIPNQLTDRIYIGTKSGTIQCLREFASKVPYFHADEITDSTARPDPMASAGEPKPEENNDAIGEAEIDPFKVIGSDDKPAEEEMSEEEEDPFKVKGDGGF